MAGCGATPGDVKENAIEHVVASSGPTVSSRKLNTGKVHPPGVPADFVITPNGYFHPSCVLELADGDSLESDHIKGNDGSIRTFDKCTYPHFDHAGREVKQGSVLGPFLHEQSTPSFPNDGWQGSISATSQGNVNQLEATFTVPGDVFLAPFDGPGVIYFFPGVEDTTQLISILQPVLEWNQFGEANLGLGVNA